MAVYTLIDAETPKNDGEVSVWEMNEDELLEYLQRQKDSFDMSLRTLGSVYEDDGELREFVEEINDLGETLTKKEYNGLVANIKKGRVGTVYNKDIRKLDLYQKLQVAKGAYYMAWALNNKKNAQMAKKQLNRKWNSIFEGNTTLEDWD